MKKIIVIILVILSLGSISFAQEDVVRDGSTIEKAVIIKYTGNYQESLGQEYEYAAKVYGRRGVDWELIMQSNTWNDGKSYDVLEIELIPSGEKTGLIFDVTDLMDKWKM